MYTMKGVTYVLQPHAQDRQRPQQMGPDARPLRQHRIKPPLRDLRGHDTGWQ